MSVSFSTEDYVPPDWSALPKYSYHLQIIKDGCIIGNINLKHKQFILVGRASQICDLYIDNPSISRKHAIIQFKANDDYGYLYDLGGKHGTEVNKQKLPPRAYQRLRPFDLIKFGVSSRSYVFRCPQLENHEKQQQNEADNKFQQVLAQRKKQLSKQQLKEKYMDLLENDPIFKANNLNRKLHGEGIGQKVNGVDWGISDQYEIYSYKNQSQFQLEPDVIRRLPGLDQIQLNRITEYQTNLRKYEQIQSQLNQLANKERRQFGLQDKLRDKKQKLQKRFVEAVQTLQKSQDWIRVNLFGDKEGRVVKKQRAQKQDDTFEDDQFFDRTLKDKKNRKVEQIEENKNQQKNTQNQMFTTQDYWKLQKQLRDALKHLIQLQKQQNRGQNININGTHKEVRQQRQRQKQQQNQYQQQFQNNNQNQQQNQQDDLDAYMKQNNQNLQKQQHYLNNQRILQLQTKIKNIKEYLIPLIGFTQVQKIQDEQRNIKKSSIQSQDERKSRKEAENKKKISDVLLKLDIIKQMQQQVDEEDVRIFDKFRDIKQQNQDQQQDSYNHRKRNRPAQINQQSYRYEQKRRVYPSAQAYNQSRDQNQKQQQQEQFYDLTKFK